MKPIVGTSIADKIFNAAIFRDYRPEGAAAIAATVALENAGTSLIQFRGDRFKRYMKYCSDKELDYRFPDTKIAYIFDDLNKNIDFDPSRIKNAETVEEAVLAFTGNYLRRTLSQRELITYVATAYEIQTLMVGLE